MMIPSTAKEHGSMRGTFEDCNPVIGYSVLLSLDRM